MTYTYKVKYGTTTTALADEKLTLKTRGLLAYILTTNFRFKFDPQSLANALPEGITTIQMAIRQLLHHQYIERT